MIAKVIVRARVIGDGKGNTKGTQVLILTVRAARVTNGNKEGEGRAEAWGYRVRARARPRIRVRAKIGVKW